MTAPTRRKPDALQTDPVFKGWTKPGPLPAGVVLELGEDETVDALSGHYRILQAAHGHRFSTDDVLVAWYGSAWCPSAGRVLDLGSGIGSVAMIAAWRLRGAHFITVEVQGMSVDLARRSAAYNGILERFDLRKGDFRDPAVLDGCEPFDLVLSSPPYWPRQAGLQGEHPQKAACRFELHGDLRDYCATAGQHLAPGGVFACVFPMHPESQAERVREAARHAELTIVRLRRVRLREGEDYQLGLFIMQRSSDLPASMRESSWEEPELVIRTAEGAVHPEYRALKLAVGFPP